MLIWSLCDIITIRFDHFTPKSSTYVSKSVLSVVGVPKVSGSRHAAIRAVVGADAGAVALAARRALRAHRSFRRNHHAAVRARLRLEAHPHLRHAQS